MNTLTIVFCLLSVLSSETYTLNALSPRSHTSPASALMNRNQAESSEEEFRFPRISDTRMRSSKVVSPQTPAVSVDNNQTFGIPASSVLYQYRQMQDAILRETKLQSAQIAEAYLRRHADPCMENSYCILGQNLEDDSQISTSELLSMDILKRMLSSVKEDPEADRESLLELATIRSIISAFELGRQIGDNRALCDTVFPCAADSKKQGRSVCNKVRTVCPALAISCSMCGIFNPQLCGRVCIVTAGSCGLSLYSCMIAQAVTKKTLAPFTKVPTTAASLTA